MKFSAFAFVFTAAVANIASAGIVIQDLGTTAPPAILGGRIMTPFANDVRPTGSLVNLVPSPLGGNLTLTPSLTHEKIGFGWATWSHGYTGDVYWTPGPVEITGVPSYAGAFYLYAQPNNFSTYNITVISSTNSVQRLVSGNGGANGFGIYGTGGELISQIIISADGAAGGFAIGEFGIAAIPEPGQWAMMGVTLFGAVGYGVRKYRARQTK